MSMAEKQYAYAVARIRSRELELLTGAFIEQLLAAKNEEECLRLLAEKGWAGGTSEVHGDPEEFLTAEREKIWALMRELVGDMSVFDVFLYETDYHNLKAAVKASVTGIEAGRLMLEGGSVLPAEIWRAVSEQKWGELPEEMQEPAEKAFSALLHTGDGQLCDMIVDKAALLAIGKAAGKSGSQVIRAYGEEKVAAADIRIAARCAKTRKPLEFIREALAPCSSLDWENLAASAARGEGELLAYLSSTSWTGAAEALSQSFSAFEKWCDDRLMELIRPQKYNPFTVSPLAAYVLARENEIRMVRMILSGKRNSLPEDSIRERVREMYV
ncbi:MAG: V-type ATPase subunit [Hydrogeniiclostridium sp.]|mgnify:CR=1 FL=1